MTKKSIFAVLFLILGITFFSFTVKAQTSLNFSITLTPGAITTAKPTTNITKTIYIQTSLLSGKSSSVSFSVSGLPNGVTLSKSPSSCSPTCTSTAKILISPNVSPGKYYIQFTANRGSVTKTSNLQLIIEGSNTVTNSLTVSRSGTGSGTVTSTDGKINCGSDCTETYSSTTSVILEAAPSSGSTFANWSGCTSTSGATCTISVSGMKTVIVTFNKTATTPTTSSIKVVSPNGGEMLQAGKTHSIIWKMQNPGKVKIYFCKGTLFKTCSLIPNFPTGGVSTGALGDTTIGEYKLYIEPKSSYVGQKLKVKVVSMQNTSVYDLSDNYFTVTAANANIEPSLQILSPNGGEQLKEYYDYEIKWIQKEISKINIELVTGNSATPIAVYMLTFNYPTESGKYLWNVRNHSPQFNTLYRIRIYDALTSRILDESDNYFSISSYIYNDLNSLKIEKTGDAKNAGVVKSNVGKIDCGGICYDEFTPGTVVTLTAEPSEWGYSYFAGWSGHCSGTGKCVITMDNDKIVTATFYSTGGSYVLNATTSGTGSGRITGAGIDCGADCTETLKGGTKFTLTANADKGSKFVSWSGGYCSGDYYKCNGIINQNIDAKAIFEKDNNEELNHLNIELLSQYKKMGKIISDSIGIDCGTKCDVSLASGTAVTLTAIANQGYRFNSFWGDYCSNLGTSTTCSFNLDMKKASVGGWFSEDYQARSLTVVYPNGGEKLSFNTPITVKWKSTGEITTIKKMGLISLENNNNCYVAENIPAISGKYTLTLAENQLCPYGGYLKPGKYKLSIEGDSSSLIYGYWDVSDDYFTLTGRYITSGIAPNSTWIQGSRYTIPWDSAGVDRLSVAAVCSNTYYRIANNILASKKSVAWKIPTNKDFTNPCKIWIGEYKGLKNQGKWSDAIPAAYNQKYVETDITIVSNKSSSIFDSMYVSIFYSIFRFLPGF